MHAQKFSKPQLDALSKLVLDLGKLFFGSVVVGFFVPSLNISAITFFGGVLASLTLFIFGISILKTVEKI